MQRPSIPKGTRDFTPAVMLRRNYIFSTIREVFALWGYAQIETPAMEQLSTLMGKYGEEGDRLLFRILNSGNYLEDVDPAWLEGSDLLAHLTNHIAEKGLRYDLTVPFARFVVQHRDELVFPFKRCQIQPVWRADRPQKGRYREFYQCDADVVGTDSLLAEVELIEMAGEVFNRLELKTRMHLNNRKVLAGIAEVLGETERLVELTVAMDKLDKIGLEGVISELMSKGFSEETIERFKPFLSIEGDNDSRLAQMAELLLSSAVGTRGVDELRFLFAALQGVNLGCELIFDPALARGLGYYTGAIMEVKSTEVEIGSISGGGRYDNLTGIFGLEGMSGVGISFGADRIYDVLDKLDRFPKKIATATQVLIINFGPQESAQMLQPLRQLRLAGIAAELYLDEAKLKKQLTYADQHAIPYVLMAGSRELADGVVTIKDMTHGTQETVAFSDLVSAMYQRLTAF